MNTSMYNTALQIESSHYKSVPENSEEYAERYGLVVVLPTLVDRITLQVGQLLITMGQKLTAAGTKNLKLFKDVA